MEILYQFSPNNHMTKHYGVHFYTDIFPNELIITTNTDPVQSHNFSLSSDMDQLNFIFRQAFKDIY